MINTGERSSTQWDLIKDWVEGAESREPSVTQVENLSVLIGSASKQDPDLAVELVESVAIVLSERGSNELARDLVLGALRRMSNDIRRWPSMALRIGARSRLGRLQTQWFDLLPEKEGAALSRPLTESLWSVIDLNGAEETLAASDAGVSLSDELRDKLSKSIFTDSDFDQRQLFIGLSTSELPAREPGFSTVPAMSSDTTDVSNQLIIVPALGKTRFRLIATMGLESKVCLTMPAAAYRRLVEDFDAVLEGASSDALRLDDEAANWFRRISSCVSPASTVRDWWVVSTPATPPLPWSWIAARADRVGAVEPAVTVGFSRPRQPFAIRLPFESADVFQLDLGGDESLPGSSGEERDVLALLSEPEASASVEVLRAPVRTDALLSRISKPGNLIHLIGHSNDVREGQLYSGIWFPESSGPTLLTMPELAATQSRASLVVLSACGTGIRDQSGASVKVGLGEAFVAGGATAVVAASNRASDSASARWVGEFYRNLIRTHRPAASLRAARRYLRSLPPFRHPKYWAAIDLLASSRGAQRAQE
jgi:hypothetical protein